MHDTPSIFVLRSLTAFRTEGSSIFLLLSTFSTAFLASTSISSSTIAFRVERKSAQPVGTHWELADGTGSNLGENKPCHVRK
eukprot:2702433-Amphidinium_carterae.1